MPRPRTATALLTAAATLAGPLLLQGGASAAVRAVTLVPVATATTGGAEIVTHDARSQRLFVTQADPATLFVLDARTSAPIASLALASYGRELTSVDARDGIVVAVVKATVPGAPGTLVVLDASTLQVLRTAELGAEPDAAQFTPDGTRVVVADEGEPVGQYCEGGLDPEGSVSVVDVATGTSRQARFDQVRLPAGVRVYGPGATAAQDIEPEYVAVTPDSRTAYVTLQENNAIAVVDLDAARVTRVIAAGYQDHGRVPLDASDEDGVVGDLQTYPGLLGMRQPDAIAAYESKQGEVFTVSAGEGDARDYECFSEQTRIGDTGPAGLERLRTTTAPPTPDRLYAYGSRSFTVRDARGNVVFDSRSQLERLTLEQHPELFNASEGEDPDSRSDDKGPEPEGLAVGSAFGRTYAFVALERGPGAVVVADVTRPQDTTIVDIARQEGDVAPEGLEFVPAADSPTRRPLLVVANEVSGTVTTYELRRS